MSEIQKMNVVAETEAENLVLEFSKINNVVFVITKGVVIKSIARACATISQENLLNVLAELNIKSEKQEGILKYLKSLNEKN